jgi:hypothetical protein
MHTRLTTGGFMRTALIAGLAILVLGAAGCGGSSSKSSGAAANPNAPEVSPAGDIPDNQAFVAYSPPQAGFTVSVPEGWSRSTAAGAVTFTDKLNAINLQTAPSSVPLTVRDAKRSVVPKLAKSEPGFALRSVSAVTRKTGKAVRIVYLTDAKPNAVTGKAGQDAVERYVFFHNGKDVIVTLSGPKGADNVDPWRIVTDSVQWSR